MKILVVSDIHYELGSHHGVDESEAFDWLAKKVRKIQPEFLVGLGDWGRAWIKPQWDELIRLCQVSAIYGNHDKLELLRQIVDRDGTKALAQDGSIRTIGGLRFGFINGIVSETGRTKEGIPRKTMEEYVAAGAPLAGVDVLCTHESPYSSEYGNRIHSSPGIEAVQKVIETIKPRLALSGHLSGSYTIARIGDTTCLRVDSSPAEKHFALLEIPDGILRIYHDHELVREVPNVI